MVIDTSFLQNSNYSDTALTDFNHNMYCVLVRDEGMYYYDMGCLANMGLIVISRSFKGLAYTSIIVLILKFIAYKLSIKYEESKNHDNYLLAYNVLDYVGDFLLIVNFFMYFYFIKIGLF